MGDTRTEGVNALVCLKDEREEEDKKAPTVGGRHGVCVCGGGYGRVHIHRSKNPGAAGCRVVVDGGQGRLHGEGVGATWAKPAIKVRSILQSEQHWLGACLVSEEGWSGGWHGAS